MAEKVKLSKDGNSIDFAQSENIPTSMKKFRQSPEIEGFYRFIYENDLQKEAFEILERIVNNRKLAKKALKQEAAQTKKIENEKITAAANEIKQAAKQAAKLAKAPPAKPAKVVAPVKAAAKPAAKPVVKAAAKAAPAKAKPVAKGKPAAKPAAKGKKK